MADRIGFYICHCGINIASKVRCGEVAAFISALEDVVLTQWELRPRPELILRIRCRSMDALMEGKRSMFKGNVRVSTPELGATGKRLYFHQVDRKFYVVGDARAWNFDEKGKRTNMIVGNKIVHFLDDRRSVVLGGVTAQVYPDKKTGRRTLQAEEGQAGRK